jgi:homoserine kinase
MTTCARIEIPGSTSNLGPGFDALGLALQLPLTLDVELGIDAPNGITEFVFEPALAGPNAILRGYRTALGHATGEVPAMRVRVHSAIPVCAGLGSSAAALVAGLRLAALVGGPGDTQTLLDTAARLEGHPDNTSASLLGGFVTSCLTVNGQVAAISSPWPADLRLVVATPDLPLETRVARSVLPEAVSHGDAVANVQRAALLVHALRTGDRRWLREALRDRLHQPYRARLVPAFDDALALDQPSLLGVFLSGAGPSIAAIVEGDGTAVAAAFRGIYAERALACTVRVLEAALPGPPPGPSARVIAAPPP